MKHNTLKVVFEFIFYGYSTIALLITVLCNIYELEYTHFVNERLLSEGGLELSFKKTQIFRACFTVATFLPLFFLSNEYILIVLTGIFLTPTLNFFIPVK